ncbi:alpha/beta fold hydrolase [Arthrobacter sp. MDT1-48-3]
MGVDTMTTFVLIHGGGSTAWDWHLVSAVLQESGHDVVAVDLPSEDAGDPRGLHHHCRLRCRFRCRLRCRREPRRRRRRAFPGRIHRTVGV